MGVLHITSLLTQVVTQVYTGQTILLAASNAFIAPIKVDSDEHFPSSKALHLHLFSFSFQASTIE